jgi:hypothetical protein
MGLYDTVRIDESHVLPGFSGDPAAVEWQTKELARQPVMDTYRITASGQLLKEDCHYEEVPEAERPRYNEELGGFEKDYEKMFGMLSKVHEGWADTEYHGIFEFHSVVDGEYTSFKAKFTDGELVEFQQNDR